MASIAIYQSLQMQSEGKGELKSGIIRAKDSIVEHEGIASNGASWKVLNADATIGLKHLDKNTFNCIITSPPYFWLRDYGMDGQLGLEDSVEEYIAGLMAVMDEAFRVLRPDGVFFLNIGDTYYSGKGESRGKDPKNPKRRFGLRAVDKSGGLGIGLKKKSLIGIPWRIALAMVSRGWILRSSIIWYQKAALPEAVKDRPKRSYENIFMFTKSGTYHFNNKPLDAEAQQDMWTIIARPRPTEGLKTAPYPDELVQRCLDLACPEGGRVLDPFAGSGTTVRVAVENGFDATGIELNTAFTSFITKQLHKI